MRVGKWQWSDKFLGAKYTAKQNFLSNNRKLMWKRLMKTSFHYAQHALEKTFLEFNILAQRVKKNIKCLKCAIWLNFNNLAWVIFIRNETQIGARLCEIAQTSRFSQKKNGLKQKKHENIGWFNRFVYVLANNPSSTQPKCIVFRLFVHHIIWTIYMYRMYPKQTQ